MSFRFAKSFQYTGPRWSVKNRTGATRSARALALRAELAQERPRLRRRARARVALHDPLPAFAGRRGVLQRAMAQSDLEQRLGDLRALWIAVDHLLELGERLPEIPLAIVRLANPVLRVRRQLVLRKAIDQFAELDDGLAVLFRTKARHRIGVELVRRNVARAGRPRLASRGRGRERRHLALHVLDRGAKLRQCRLTLLERFAHARQLLPRRFHVGEDERLLRVERLDLLGESRALARGRVVVLLEVLHLCPQIGHLGLSPRALVASTRARRERRRDRHEKRPRRDRGHTLAARTERHASTVASRTKASQFPRGFAAHLSSASMRAWTRSTGRSSPRPSPPGSSSASSCNAVDFASRARSRTRC